jgi:transcriptional regulator, crp/fnr family
MKNISSSLFQQYLEIIGKSELFSGLPVDLCSEVIAHSQHRSFARDQFLLHHGDVPRYTAFILKGNLITLRSNAEGDETVIRLLGSGETCMEAILFPQNGPSPISVRAVKPSEVLCIDAAYLTRLSESNAQFSRNLVNILAFYYRRAMQQIDAITIQDAQMRLGQYLLDRYLL